MLRIRKTNPQLIRTIEMLRRRKERIWRRVAEDLQKPKRKWRRVNLARINRYTKEGDVVVVPGKVLAFGSLDHKIKIWAFSFSKTAVEKIQRAGGEILRIEALIEQNPRGSGVKLIG